MATRPAGKFNSSSKSATVAPFCAVRRSPLTVMASDVSIEASLARFSLALLLDSVLNPHFLILSLSDGYALLGAELEAQMAFGGGVGGFDDDGGVGIVEAGHVESEMCFAVRVGFGGKISGFVGTGYCGADFCGADGMAGAVGVA